MIFNHLIDLFFLTKGMVLLKAVIPLGTGTFTFRSKSASTHGPGTQRSISGSRTSSTSITLYYDGSPYANTATADTGTVPSGIWASGGYMNSLGAFTGGSLMTSQTEAVGGGLTDAEMLTLYNAAVAYNSTVVPGGRLG